MELKPEYLTEKKDFDQEYYEKLDQLENDVLDGKTFKTISSGNEKDIKKFKLVNSRKTKEDGTVIKDIRVEETITLAMLSTALFSEYIDPTK